MTGLMELAARATPAHPTDLTEGGRPVLLLAPHPDDETLGCGVSIAALAQQDIRVQVVLVTDGAASHPASRLYPPARMAALRSAELHEALRILVGPDALPVIELSYPDLAAPDGDALIAQAADRIISLIDFVPGAIWTTWAGDPHPDHQRVSRLTEKLLSCFPGVQGWSYPIWGRFDGNHPLPALDDLRIVDLPDQQATKSLAIAAHASQMTALVPDDPSGFVMQPEHQAHFADHPEIFIRMRPHAG